MLLELPLTGYYFILYAFGACSKTRFKEKLYRFLRHVKNVEQIVEEFWEYHQGSMADFYKKKHRRDDIIISASPEFLLKPICRILEVDHLICSKVHPMTGIYDGLNCHGEEKVRRLREEMPEVAVQEFYSDSLSDTPMAKVAKKAYLVKKGKIMDWPWHN